jgi:hypothetical protein
MHYNPLGQSAVPKFRQKPIWTPAVLFIRVDKVDSDDGDRLRLENAGFYLRCNAADHHIGLHNTVTNYHGHNIRNSNQQFKEKTESGVGPNQLPHTQLEV